MIPAAVHRLREELNAMSRPTVLVLDNVDILDNPYCVNAIEVLSADVPDRMQVALAGRSWPARSLARMRSDGSVLEVGPRDLTMNERETAQLLTGMGVDVRQPAIAALTLATEGWPSACTSRRCHGGKAPTSLRSPRGSPVTIAS